MCALVLEQQSKASEVLAVPAEKVVKAEQPQNRENITSKYFASSSSLLFVIDGVRKVLALENYLNNLITRSGILLVSRNKVGQHV